MNLLVTTIVIIWVTIIILILYGTRKPPMTSEGGAY